MTTSSGESSEALYRRYVAATSEGPANRLFDLLDPHLPERGEAIDLGCGTGRGTLHLLSRGLQVTAVDRESEGLDVLRSKLPDASKVEIVQAPFQDLTLSTYDVFVACYSLFFLPPSDFAEFWPKVAN